MDKNSKEKAIHNAIESFRGRIREILMQNEGAFFAFAIDDDGASGITFGGNCAYSAMMFSETLANMVFMTPALDEEYIKVVFEQTLKNYELLKSEMNGGKKQ